MRLCCLQQFCSIEWLNIIINTFYNADFKIAHFNFLNFISENHHFIYILSFPVVLLTYQRDAVLASALERLNNMPYLNKVGQSFFDKFPFYSLFFLSFILFTECLCIQETFPMLLQWGSFLCFSNGALNPVKFSSKQNGFCCIEKGKKLRWVMGSVTLAVTHRFHWWPHLYEWSNSCERKSLNLWLRELHP